MVTKYGEVVGSQPKFDAAAWVKGTGLSKKGRVCGFGTKASSKFVLDFPCSVSNMPGCPQASTQEKNDKRALQAMEYRFQQRIKERMQQRVEELQHREEELTK